tara:strand:- start:14162 stop:14425 length:264 start_codon:yes stop_codon:yes gene_type:complete
MEVSVWDTYVKRKDGLTMHFDILVPHDVQDEYKVLNFGKKYLDTKTFRTEGLTTNECRFCHSEIADSTIETEIRNHGYYIVEMENCI